MCISYFTLNKPLPKCNNMEMYIQESSQHGIVHLNVHYNTHLHSLEYRHSCEIWNEHTLYTPCRWQYAPCGPVLATKQPRGPWWYFDCTFFSQHKLKLTSSPNNHSGIHVLFLGQIHFFNQNNNACLYCQPSEHISYFARDAIFCQMTPENILWMWT